MTDKNVGCTEQKFVIAINFVLWSLIEIESFSKYT